VTHEVDPEASLALWELDVELGGRHFTVPALPASDWFPILLSGDVGRILDMMVSTGGGDPIDPLDLLLEGKLAEGELAERCIDAFEEVAGRPFGVAFILAYSATQRWATVNGRLVLAGFDWTERPLGAALDAIYAVFTENANEEGRTKFDAFLETPINTGPKGKVRKVDAERMEAGFVGIAGPKPTTGVARASGAPSDNARSRTRTQPQQPHPGAGSAEPKRPRGQRARSGPAASS
jgi:hypothetical protein